MLFNSYVFLLVFLPIALLGWWKLPNTTSRLIFLTLMSYVFYAWWNWRFVPLMMASTAVDYIAGGKIVATDNQRTRKLWLAGSLTFNLSVLGCFKYYDFFAESVNATAHLLGAQHMIPLLHIILPIGISFYTFNSMSYTIDLYRGVVKPAPSFLHFSAFVAMFPHLLAGPIVRYSDIHDQLLRLKPAPEASQAALGVFFFTTGMAKKILVADQLAAPVNAFFSQPTNHGALAAWLGVLGYTFQIYFDFSGYSDMAVGLAHLLGIRFPQNFNSPYKAVNISDFWRRWHISLSTWLRDYLFIPLGGSRKGSARTLLNVTIVMFLGGLWHGASWTFVMWGLYHGVLLMIHAVARRRGLGIASDTLSRIVTFLCASVGWVFFRAETLSKAGVILRSMFGVRGVGAVHFDINYLLMLALAAAMAFFAPNTWEMEFKPSRAWEFGVAAVLFACILLLNRETPFLYFQF